MSTLTLMFPPVVAAIAFSISYSCAHTGFVGPLARIYSPSIPNVVFLNKYACVMLYHFIRNISNGSTTPTYGFTSVPNDTSFALVEEADFLIFD